MLMSFRHPQLAGAQLGSVTDVFGPIIDYIKGQAEAGAEQAIPEIQMQVKAAVQPYVVASLTLGVIGALFGIAAFIHVKRAVP